MQKGSCSNARLFHWNLELEGYDYKVIYKPSQSMTHVDASSKAPYADTVVIQKDDETQDQTAEEIFSDISHIFMKAKNQNMTLIEL